MKILHIVPTAFEYFEKIRSSAFELVDDLNQLGFDNEIVTLQYDVVSKRMKKQVEEETGKRIGFKKVYEEDDLLEKIENADIVHLHAPFLGMGKKLLKYKRGNPQKRFLITVYQNLLYLDFFTIIIWLYNGFYLKRLLNTADFVVAENEQIFREAGGLSYLKDLQKFVPLDSFRNFLTENNVSLAKMINDSKLNNPNLHTAVAYGELYRLLSGE